MIFLLGMSEQLNHRLLDPRLAMPPVRCQQAQLRAASALRGLSVDEDLRTQIVARGGLVPLLRLSSSDDVEIQMEVCMLVIANVLSINSTAVSGCSRM